MHFSFLSSLSSYVCIRFEYSFSPSPYYYTISTMTGKERCITCNKSSEIIICNGCQQTFCDKHSIEHRQQLANQLDNIMQEHDLLKQEFQQAFNEYSLFKNIDQWEKDSIVKIQITAETARADVRQMIEKSKEQFLKAYNDIAMNIRLSRDANDYSEKELNHWMEQLKQLQLEITSSSLSPKLIENEWSVIDLLETQDNNTSTPITQDRFSKVIGNAVLDEEGFVARHTSEDWNYEYVLGEQLYSHGRHTVLFKIEQNGTPYNIFFGCISSQAIQNKICIKSSYTVGWFGYNQIYQHGIHNCNSNLHGYNSNEFGTNDILHLTFDCEKQQIELFHEDTDKTHILRVNINKAPFPWQFLMVLSDKDDCVRILPIDKFYSVNKIQTHVLLE